jgi:hypothetical protein
MKNDPHVADPFGPVANIGRRLREIFGEAYGDLDDRMLELLHELDFIPSGRAAPPRVVQARQSEPEFG